MSSRTWREIARDQQSGPALDLITVEESKMSVESFDQSDSGWFPFDLIAAFGLTLLAASSVLFEFSLPLRVPLGVLLVLFLPGYALTSSLFASRDGPDEAARIALSVALSLATVPPLALGIDWSPWPIERETVTVGLSLVSTLGLVLAVVMRIRLPLRDRYIAHPSLTRIRKSIPWTRESRILATSLGVVGVLFIFGGYDAVKTRMYGKPMTELALYNATGAAQFYPREIELGEPAEVQVAITNHEGRQISYSLLVGGAGRAVGAPVQVTLESGQTWQGSVRFTVDSINADLAIRFELYRSDRPDQSTPYRLLILYVEGIESSGT